MILGALAVVGAAERAGLVAHQLLEEHPKKLTKKVRAGLIGALAQGDGERDAGLGHGRRPPEDSKSALETFQTAGRGSPAARRPDLRNPRRTLRRFPLIPPALLLKRRSLEHHVGGRDYSAQNGDVLPNSGH